MPQSPKYGGIGSNLMNNQNSTSNPSSQIDFEKLFLLIAKNLKVLLLIAGFSFIVTGIINYFILTPKYKSVAVLTPRFESSPGKFGALSSYLSGGGSTIGQLIGLGNNETDLIQYQNILKTRQLRSNIARDIQLWKRVHPNKKPINPLFAEAEAVGFLAKYTVITHGPGILSVEFDSTDPQLAYDVAHEYITRLQSYLTNHVVTRAKAAELFIKDQIAETEKSLAAAEKTYIELQSTAGVVELSAQTTLSLNTAAQLRSELIQKNMELALYKNILKDSRKVSHLRQERDQIQSQLNGLIKGDSKVGSGRKKSKASKNTDILTPLSKVPDLQIKFADVKREYLTEVKLLDLLREQYELARINSKRNESMFDMIDPPTVPLGPYSPKKLLNTLIGGFFGFLIGIFAILIIDKFRNFQRMPKRLLRIVKSSDDDQKIQIA